MEVKEFTIVLRNVPGALAETTRQLAYWGINIRAVTVSQAGEYSILHLVLDDPVAAERVLKEGDFIFSMTPLLAIAVPDEPGALAKVSTILGDAGVNINYLYTLVNRGKSSVLLAHLDDLPRAKKLLTENQLEVLDLPALANF